MEFKVCPALVFAREGFCLFCADGAVLGGGAGDVGVCVCIGRAFLRVVVRGEGDIVVVVMGVCGVVWQRVVYFWRRGR